MRPPRRYHGGLIGSRRKIRVGTGRDTVNRLKVPIPDLARGFGAIEIRSERA
jgi:hypothetical protein